MTNSAISLVVRGELSRFVIFAVVICNELSRFPSSHVANLLFFHLRRRHLRRTHPFPVVALVIAYAEVTHTSSSFSSSPNPFVSFLSSSGFVRFPCRRRLVIIAWLPICHADSSPSALTIYTFGIATWTNPSFLHDAFELDLSVLHSLWTGCLS